MMFESEVTAGVTILDYHDPEWYEKIDLERLDMQSIENDILGQLFGGYFAGLDKLGIPRYTTDDTKCGFDAPKDFADEEHYLILTDEWTKRVRNRL